MKEPQPPGLPALSRRKLLVGTLTAAAVCSVTGDANAQVSVSAAPLGAWQDGPAKQAILAFVRAATDAASPNFVKPADRIATFDQDGTLWVEHPLYAQGMFAVDRVIELAPRHPEWTTSAPFSVVLSKNPQALSGLSESDWTRILAATHTGMSTEAFLEIVERWIATAKHPRYQRLYTDLIYEPMREVMSYLRDHDFKTYIVTGGGQEFVRAYAQNAYGVPPEQVIGSSIQTKYELVDGKPALMREPAVFLDDDHAGKAIGINLFIGKRPYAAFGNSTGDQQMLEWTGAGSGARLKMLVHHDDPVREYAYGPAGGLPNTKVGTFSAALMSEARSRGWIVVSMKNDWQRMFSFD